MHKANAILKPHCFMRKDQWLFLLNALITFDYSWIAGISFTIWEPSPL